MKKFTTFGLISILFVFVVSGCSLFKDESKTTTPLSNKEFQAVSMDQEVYQNAVSILDSKLCNSIKDKDFKTDCVTMIQDKKLLAELVEKSENLSDCEQLTISELKEICSAKIENRIKIDKDQAETQERNLLLGKIIKEGDIGKCKEFEDKMWESLCEDGVYRKKALDTKDKTLCAKISNETDAQVCEDLLVK